ncbi:hypothetical protein D9M71_364250 [compost metagenome]
MLANAHEFTGAQGSGVRQDQPGRRLPDDAGSTQRDHQADQHRQTFERIGPGTRQVGISHGQGKQPDRQRRQALGGFQGFVVQPVEGAGRRHAPQYPAREGCGASCNEEDRQRYAESGDGPENPLQQIVGDFQQIVVKAFTPGPGIGKTRQDKPQPFVGEQQHDDPAQHFQHAADQWIEEVGVDQRHPPDLQGLGVPMHQVGQFFQQFAP